MKNLNNHERIAIKCQTHCSAYLLTIAFFIFTLAIIPMAKGGDFTMYGTIGPTSDSGTLVRVNPNNGQQSYAGPIGSLQNILKIDANPITGKLVGIDPYNNRGVIKSFDPATNTSETLATIYDNGQPLQIQSIAFSPNGRLYGIAGLTYLGVIDINRNAFRPIYQFSGGSYVAGIDFSPDGVLYAVLGGSKNKVQSINLSNYSVINEVTIPTSYSVGDIDFAPDGYIYHTNSSYALFRINPLTGEQTNVGYGGIGALSGIASIPEPASLSLLAIGGLLLKKKKIIKQ